jgi:hypothetical protein
MLRGSSILLIIERSGYALMRWTTNFTIFLVALTLVGSLAAYAWVESGSGFKVCTPPDPSELEKYVKTIAALDQVVDLGIKLSTTLAGLGAALLLGLKTGVRSTPFVRFCIFFSTILFVQSALYAIWWRTGIAELWFNDCLALIAETRLQYRFNAHFYFFVGGLISIGLLVLGAMFAPPTEQSTSGDFS